MYLPARQIKPELGSDLPQLGFREYIFWCLVQCTGEKEASRHATSVVGTVLRQPAVGLRGRRGPTRNQCGRSWASKKKGLVQGYLVVDREKIGLGNFGTGITGVLRCLVQGTLCVFLLCMLHGFSQSLVYHCSHSWPNQYKSLKYFALWRTASLRSAPQATHVRTGLYCCR
jgi:hypothetical protein